MLAHSIVAVIPIALMGCARPVTTEPAPPSVTSASATSPAAPPTSPSALPWPDAATCTAARTPTTEPSVDADLHTIIGGHYSPDHIGPDAFAAIEAHVQREPDAFLDAWAHTALDPETSVDRHWDDVLARTIAARPERTRELAACLLVRVDAALAHPPAGRDVSWDDRVGSRRLGLYLRWRGRPDDGSWRLALPSRACTTTADGITTLTVEVDCTCGEPILCDVAAGPERLDVLVTFDPTAYVMCDDCYPGRGRCTLPATWSGDRPTLNGRLSPVLACPS